MPRARTARMEQNTEEHRRLREAASREKNWKRWGPYLSERQWATVREDYSPNGDPWTSFPHDHARSRAYRWGEDGLLGITDHQCRLCLALALWNTRDPILKERLFGLTGPEGNHGEDVKECYFYLESTPTHSYLRALYKYPHAAFPYGELVRENRKRGLLQPEFELEDTGVFDNDAYFDVGAEYAKRSPNDILVRITIANRGSEPATIHVLPTLWFRNVWSWGTMPEMPETRPKLRLENSGIVLAKHPTLGSFRFHVDTNTAALQPEAFLFTENETNQERLFNATNASPYLKDAFHRYVIDGETAAVNPAQVGTKCAPHYVLTIPSRDEVTIRMRLTAEDELEGSSFGDVFDTLFARRITEATDFFNTLEATTAAGVKVDDARNVLRQAYAGLLWTKQFYYYTLREWLAGDPAQPKPPESRMSGRNSEWKHFYSRDVLSMPDKWEYPWFASWDLAFHMIPFARVDPDFAKKQLLLLLREWYMHPNGQIPAYEFAFNDVNPPVHAWAAWRVYKISAARGMRDTRFLESVFQKLLLNFTWWVNRKDHEGNNLFSGGFLGLDNIGVFDRSQPLPTGGYLQQADGTAWMAFYCLTMLAISVELARSNSAYEDMASKFFEHFILISDAMNHVGGTGLWDDEDGFYYDELRTPGGRRTLLKTRSLVGLLPLIAVEVFDIAHINRLPGFWKRVQWFLKYRTDLATDVTLGNVCPRNTRRMLAIPTREKLVRVLRYLFDENEFLSPYGIRSLSRYHLEHPYIFRAANTEHRVDYVPGAGNSFHFGGNSNWRGPVWFPVNYLLIEALERYHHFFRETLLVEFPTGSGQTKDLQEIANDLARRLSGIFLRGENSARPFAGSDRRFVDNPHWKDLVLFHEYFHGDDGHGLGASHQTGWTALVSHLIEGQYLRQGRKDS